MINQVKKVIRNESKETEERINDETHHLMEKINLVNQRKNEKAKNIKLLIRNHPPAVIVMKSLVIENIKMIRIRNPKIKENQKTYPQRNQKTQKLLRRKKRNTEH